MWQSYIDVYTFSIVSLIVVLLVGNFFHIVERKETNRIFVIVLENNNIEIYLTPEDEVLSAINRICEQSTHMSECVKADMDGNESSEILSQHEKTADLLDDTNDAPIIRIVDFILS